MSASKRRPGRPRKDRPPRLTAPDLLPELNILLACPDSLPLGACIEKVIENTSVTKDAMMKAHSREKQGGLRDAGKKDHPKLAHIEESALVAFICAMEEASMPLNKDDVRSIMETLHPHCTETGFGQWYSRFLDRYPHTIKHVRSKAISYARTSEKQRARVENFIDCVKKYGHLEKMGAKYIYNVDETTLRYTETHDAIGSATGIFHGNTSSRNQEAGSLITFRGTDGHALLETIVLKARLPTAKERAEGSSLVETTLDIGGISSDKYALRGSDHTYFMFRESGKLDQRCFRLIMEKFRDLWLESNPGLHCLLFMDGCSSHKEKKLWLDMFKSNINMFLFPANSTAWIQPLDLGLFGPLKNRAYKVFVKLTRKDIMEGGTGDHVNLKAFMEALCSFKHDYTMQLISKWEEAGVWPFDEDKIRARMDRVLGSTESTADMTARLQKESGKISVIQGGAIMSKMAQTAIHDIKGARSPAKKVRKVSAPDGMLMSGRQLYERVQQTQKEKRERDAKIAKEKHLKEVDRQLVLVRKRLQRARDRLEKFVLKTNSCFHCQTEFTNDEETDGIWKECQKCALFSFCEICLGGDHGERLEKRLDKHVRLCDKRLRVQLAKLEKSVEDLDAEEKKLLLDKKKQ